MKADQFQRTVGWRVKQARYRAGLTQEQLAKRARISRTQITNIELGNSSTKLWSLARIAAACGLMLHQLLDPTYDLLNGAGHDQMHQRP